ncbi:MAG: hypothetical protein QXI19_09450 [Candidatus Caldarchaeum sp.]
MKVFGIGACLFLFVLGHAQRVVPVGLDVGVYLPTDSTVRNTFGKSWWRIGLTPLSFQDPDMWRFTLDIGVIGNQTTLGRALLIPVTVGATRSFESAGDGKPYVAVRVGGYYGDVFSPPLGINSSRVGFNGNVAVGVSFQDSFYIEARYDVFSEFRNLDFNGFFISAGVKVFQVRL